jgi:hypothetical protein
MGLPGARPQQNRNRVGVSIASTLSRSDGVFTKSAAFRGRLSPLGGNQTRLIPSNEWNDNGEQQGEQMNHRLSLLFAVFIAVSCPLRVQASPFVSFKDLSERSPSKRYEVKAQSPDNHPDSDRRFWQSKFVFTCTDTRNDKIVWTRKQREEDEGSPIALFVSDTGWTVIRTFLDDVICIDKEGTERGTVDLLRHAFVGTEFKDYFHCTSAGFYWGRWSLWYFLEADGQNLFVIRPWWGRRILIDVESGGLAKTSPLVEKAIVDSEHDYVITELARGVRTRDEWELEFGGTRGWRVVEAAYLAGVLKFADAVPDLVKLQDSNYCGSCAGLLDLEKFDGEVDPHSYSTNTLRQAVHLSLRRLDTAPGHWPAHEFSTHYEDYKRNTIYEPKPPVMPRHTRLGDVRKGMKAEEVLDLIGAPDFIGRDTWEYDMDTKPPHSLIVNWNRRRVTGTEKRIPALWQNGVVRDRQFAY